MSEERKTRQAVLWKARNRAYSLLAQRYPNEYADLRDALLRRWGHEPADPAMNRRSAIVTETTPEVMGSED